MDTKQTIKNMLKIEINTVNNLESTLNFEIIENVCEKIAKCKGNVIFAR